MVNAEPRTKQLKKIKQNTLINKLHFHILLLSAVSIHILEAI